MNNNVYWNNDCRPWTSTTGKFSGKRGGTPMDVLKYQVFPCQKFPRHVLLRSISSNENNFSQVRDHDNDDDEATT